MNALNVAAPTSAKSAAITAANVAPRSVRATNATRGLDAERQACDALMRDGWRILGQRVRTAAGEIDALAEKDGLLAVVEVKSRPTLAMAAAALGPRQQGRLMAAAEIVMGAHPEWGANGVRFDVMLVDGQNRVRRVADAFRLN